MEQEATNIFLVDGCDEESVGRGRVDNHLTEGLVALDRNDLQAAAVLGVPETNLAIAGVRVELIFGKGVEEASEDASLVSNLGMSDPEVNLSPMSFSIDSYSRHTFGYSFRDIQTDS